MSATPRTPAPDAGTPPHDERTGRSVVAVIGFLVFVELCSGVLQGALPAVVPVIGKTLKVSSGDLNWVSSLPLLVAGLSVPLLTKLGDTYGHRRIIRITVALVAAGSIVAATADSFGLLLVGLALQGVYTAWLPLEIAIVRDRIDPKRSGAAIGLLVGALSAGVTLGTLGIGLLSKQAGGMHALLWLPAGFILACLPVVFFLIPDSTTRDRDRIDWIGPSLLSLGLGAALLGLARGTTWGWSSPQILALFTGSVVLLAGFAAVELRVPAPFVDIRMIASRTMAPLYVLSFVLGCTLYGSLTAGATFSATPKIFGFGFGLDTLDRALIALPSTVAMFLAATIADRVVRAVGARATVTGAFALVATGYVGTALFHGQLWTYIVTGVLTWIGIGLALGALPTVIMGGLRADQTGVGMGLYNTLKSLAGAVVGAGFAVIMNQNLLKLPIPGLQLSNEHAYVLVWSICGAIALVGALVAMAIRKPTAIPVPIEAGVPAATSASA